VCSVQAIAALNNHFLNAGAMPASWLQDGLLVNDISLRPVAFHIAVNPARRVGNQIGVTHLWMLWRTFWMLLSVPESGVLHVASVSRDKQERVFFRGPYPQPPPGLPPCGRRRPKVRWGLRTMSSIWRLFALIRGFERSGEKMHQHWVKIIQSQGHLEKKMTLQTGWAGWCRDVTQRMAGGGTSSICLWWWGTSQLRLRCSLCCMFSYPLVNAAKKRHKTQHSQDCPVMAGAAALPSPQGVYLKVCLYPHRQT